MIRNSLEYLEDEQIVPSDDTDLAFYRDSLGQESPDVRQVLQLCNYLKDGYATWLDSVIGTLHKSSIQRFCISLGELLQEAQNS